MSDIHREEPLEPATQEGEVGKRRRITKVRLVGLFLGPALLVIILLLPLSLNWQQQSLMGLIVMTVTWWITQPMPIPVTSVLAITLAVVLQVAPAKTVFGAFSSPTLFLLIGGFLITVSMVKYGLAKRMALSVLSIPGIGGSTYRIVIAFGLFSALLSGVIDNGAVAAMLVPIGIGLVHALSGDIREREPCHSDRPLRFATALMLITAYGATLGALLTPFGDASNMVGRAFIEEEFGVLISVGQWMRLAVPIVIVLFILLVTAVLLLNRPEVKYLPEAKEHVRRNRSRLKPISQGEINTAIAFGFAVILWLSPALVALVAGQSSSAYEVVVNRLPPPVVAILAASLLFILPLGKRKGFTLRWRDTVEMDWGPILLVGSALALGRLMTDTGLADVVGGLIADRVEDISPLTLAFLSSTAAIAFSEISTNLVSITVLVPTLLPVAAAAGGDPLTVTLIATFSAIYGFMLPISTSANAIVFGSGQIPVWRMIKTGFIVDISGIVVIVLGLTIMLRFFPVV